MTGMARSDDGPPSAGKGRPGRATGKRAVAAAMAVVAALAADIAAPVSSNGTSNGIGIITDDVDGVALLVDDDDDGTAGAAANGVRLVVDGDWEARNR